MLFSAPFAAPRRRLLAPSQGLGRRVGVWLGGALALAVIGLSACSPVNGPSSRQSSTAQSLSLADAPMPQAKPAPPVQVASRGADFSATYEQQDISAQPVGLVTTADGQRVLKAAPMAAVSVFPPLPSVLPNDPNARVELLTRPPLVPPIHHGPLNPVGESAKRCQDALLAARSLVERPLTLPVDDLKESAWKEQALRGTELTQLACQGEAGEQAATYWRATAFLLHGQYSRAALYYNRIADEPTGPYAQWGYVKGLGRMLDACARADRAALDAWTLAGLLEARGARNDARLLYSRAVQARCEDLRLWSRARMAVTAGES